jgi:molybdenum cofactor biosynthesis enzyme MoaA
MKRCEMILTNACNFHCTYCQGLPPLINKAMTLEEIRAGLTYWIKNRAENIRFSGGEPTLHPNLLDAVRLCKEAGVARIGLTSNGSNQPACYRRLIEAGVSDISISLDACTAEEGDRLAGNLRGVWQRVVENIREMAKIIPMIVNVVYDASNSAKSVDTILFAHELGVKDILLIAASQHDAAAPGLQRLPQEVLEAHPILKYRVENSARRTEVRGLSEDDASYCALVLDDAVIAANVHFPCSIYMREGGKPVGRVGEAMRRERCQWFLSHNTYQDPLCRKFCVDLYIDYNNRYRQFHSAG